MRKWSLGIAAGVALLAALIVPAAASAYATVTQTLASGSADVTYSNTLSGGSYTGTAHSVTPHPAWATIPGTQWINWAATPAPNPEPFTGPQPASCAEWPQKAGLMDYTVHFDLPEGVVKPSLQIDLHADNAAEVLLNGTLIGGQELGCLTANFQGDPESFSTSDGSLFRLGQNEVVIRNYDWGVAAGIDFKLTVSYVPAVISFAPQPTQTQVGEQIDPVGVTVADPDGNPVPGVPLELALGSNPGGGELSGTTAQTTGADGVATFADLSIDEVGLGYTLVATSGTASGESEPFLIADSVTQCTGSTCSGSASSDGTSVSVDAGGSGTYALGMATGSSGLSVASGGYTLGIALLPGGVPTGACGDFVGLGSESFVGLSEIGPTLTITWQLDKALVKQRDGSRGAAHFDICLGAVYVGGPPHGFPTKGGGTATPFPDPVFGGMRYWGLLPDCAKKGSPADPCVVKRQKVKAGDALVVFVVPAPWDPHIMGG